jgi:hypothetical protein
MARGWESKAVEDQIADARDASPTRNIERTPAERERESRRASLQMARAKTLQDLQQACSPRYRALLEQTLAHLEAELAKIES